MLWSFETKIELSGLRAKLWRKKIAYNTEHTTQRGIGGGVLMHLFHLWSFTCYELLFYFLHRKFVFSNI